jgi:hypothetical protein
VVRCFHSILQIFFLCFIILLDGVPVAVSYIVNRMLAEFAAAAVVFVKGAYEFWDGGDGDVEDVGEDKDKCMFSMFSGSIKGIIQESYPSVFPYYKRCWESAHNHFIWTGPCLQIVHRSNNLSPVVSLATAGELLDHPGHCIYTVDVDLPARPPLVGKHHGRWDSMDLTEEQPKKRKC